jgi:methionyl-tRNA formyltransferase
MRVVFAGTPEVALPTLNALRASAHDVVGILTRHDAPVGRARILTRSPVGAWGDEHGIAVTTSNRPNADTADVISQWSPDIGVIVAYGALLDLHMLAVPKRGWINLHFSDLPKFRGAAPVQRALLAGETDIATSVFQLVESMDAGAVFDREHHTLLPEDTSGLVLDKLALSGAQQVVRVLDGIEAGILSAVAQAGTPTFAPKLSAQEARLDATADASAVFNVFRAVTPEPGAWLETTVGRLKVIAARPIALTDDVEVQADTGVIVERSGIVVLGLSGGALELLRVTPAGKREMAATEWLRGIRATRVDVVPA